MNGRTLLGLLALVVVGLLAWELRWVLLVLFGAIVLAVALDVPVAWLRRVTPLNRTAALALVVVVLLLGGWKLGELLIPELLDQVQELIQLVPVLITRLGEMVGDVKLLQSLESRILSLATLDKLQPVGAQLLGFAGGAANGTIQLLLLVLLAILLALDPRSHQRLLIAATPSKYRPLVGELLRECREALGAGWPA